tara:strand:- start:705 stop:2393 length:1689 start_codon:yes stop_codon:yes gene_type:complete
LKNLNFNFCGPKPTGFVPIQPSDSNYIFEKDINFQPLNLYDFFGRGATVNSYSECFYYGELGFEPNKITIFDYVLDYGFTHLFFFFLSFYLIRKFHIINKISSFYSNVISKHINKISNFYSNVISKHIYKIFLAILLIIQNFFLFHYVQAKAFKIPRFIDEYISLASNFNFFTTLDFNAGDFIGGSYSVFLTSGPISAVGGVIGWSITNNLIAARLSNFYWLLFLQAALLVVISKSKNKDLFFLAIGSNLFIVLVPWWQGSLYMIGEFASVIVFTNALFLFSKSRYISILLFSIAIFWGKLLTLLPFAIFYILSFINKPDFKNIYKDAIAFLTPLALWLLLVDKYSLEDSFFTYLYNLLDLVLGHQSSGIESPSFVSSFSSSEVQNWNNYDLARILFAPVVAFYLIFSTRKKLRLSFGNLALPISGSILSIYLWFWILSPTKWMRYSQHFTIVVLLVILYLIGFNLLTSKVQYFACLNLIALFIENNKNFIFLYLLVSIFLIFLQNRLNYKKISKAFLAFLIVLDISLVYFENTSFVDLQITNIDCQINLISEDCLNFYENK